MQAIILAAGMGKRLGDLTKENTKGQVKVLGESLIERMLKQLIINGIKRIIVVVGYKADNLKSHIEEIFGNNDEVKIEFILNPIYDKTNNIYSLYLAKDQLENDDTILLESDLLFDDSILTELINHTSSNVVVASHFESWMDGTVVTIDENQKVINFIPKANFDYNHLENYYKTVNLYKFSKSFLTQHYVPFLTAYSQSMGHNVYYEDVLRVIAFLEKSELIAMVVKDNQKWYEIDDIQDLDNAETIFATDDMKLEKYQSRYGGYWRFPKLIDFCYLVNPYFPTKVLEQELISSFSKLMSQYPSGQKVNRLLAAKTFGLQPHEVLVGNGAAELINILFSKTDKITGIIYPTFEEYSNRIRPDLVRKFIPPNPEFSYNADDIILFSEQVEQILLINPDNPSGNFILEDELIKILDYLLSQSKNLILDESFIDFADNDKKYTLLNSRTLNQYPNLIIIKSISKSYGIPGFRLGVIASSNKQLLEHVNSELSIWNINSFGEYFMQNFSKHSNDYEKACLKIAENRNWLFKELQAIPFLSTIKSQANYFLCKVKEPFNSYMLCEQLLIKYDILIKDCAKKAGFDNKNYVRIAIRNEKDNNKLISSLQELSSLIK